MNHQYRSKSLLVKRLCLQTFGGRTIQRRYSPSLSKCLSVMPRTFGRRTILATKIVYWYRSQFLSIQSCGSGLLADERFSGVLQRLKTSRRYTDNCSEEDSPSVQVKISISIDLMRRTYGRQKFPLISSISVDPLLH